VNRYRLPFVSSWRANATGTAVRHRGNCHKAVTAVDNLIAPGFSVAAPINQILNRNKQADTLYDFAMSFDVIAPTLTLSANLMSPTTNSGSKNVGGRACRGNFQRLIASEFAEHLPGRLGRTG
jgi:hypothetical protein